MISQRQLTQQLRDLGVGARPALMVHASLRKLGPVQGRADGVLKALTSAQGEAGTLLMPLGADDTPGFDALTAPVEADMGVLAEVFRTWPGTRVSDHPAGRFGAYGQAADKLLNPVPFHDYLGPGSVLERFTQLDGHVLRLGADENTITLTHYAEYLARLPHKRRVRRRYVLASGQEVFVESLDDSDGIVEWEAGDYFTDLWRAYRKIGDVTMGTVGGCKAELFTAQAYVRFATQWMEQNLR